jgi:hypothetical protein
METASQYLKIMDFTNRKTQKMGIPAATGIRVRRSWLSRLSAFVSLTTNWKALRDFHLLPDGKDRDGRTPVC